MLLKNIRRQTRRKYSAEVKIRIVLEGLRGEENISELCRREGYRRLDVLRLVEGSHLELRRGREPTGGSLLSVSK